VTTTVTIPVKSRNANFVLIHQFHRRPKLFGVVGVEDSLLVLLSSQII